MNYGYQDRVDLCKAMFDVENGLEELDINTGIVVDIVELEKALSHYKKFVLTELFMK